MCILLALALSHHAKLYLLDEPTSGLDPVSRDEILHIKYVENEKELYNFLESYSS